MDISILDLVLALILLISVGGGVVRGILKSISWLPGLVLGVFAVNLFAKSLSAIVIENTELSPLWGTYISVIVLMAGTYLVVRLLASIFASVLESIGLGAIDKILGGLFSLALCLLVFGAIIMVIDSASFLSSLSEFCSSSWLVTKVIRPFFSGTVGFVQEAL